MGIDELLTTPEESQWIKVLIYGLPGTGKTVFAATAPTPLIVDVEHGTTSLNNHPTLRTTPVIRYKSSKTLEQVIMEFTKESGETKQFDSLVIDSFSEFQRRVLDEQLSTNSGNARYIPDMQAFNLNTNLLRGVAGKLRTLQKHVIVTAHVKEEQDQIGRTLYRPDLTPKLANSLLGMMDVVGYMQMKTVKGADNKEKVIRELTLTPTKSITAKSRIGGTVIVDPVFDDLLALLKK